MTDRARLVQMKNPAHPGRLIKAEIGGLGLSTAEAANGLGFTRQQLHNVIAGRNAITPTMAVRLEMAIGGTADAWLQMQIDHDLSRVGRSSLKVRRLVGV